MLHMCRAQDILPELRVPDRSGMPRDARTIHGVPTLPLRAYQQCDERQRSGEETINHRRPFRVSPATVSIGDRLLRSAEARKVPLLQMRVGDRQQVPPDRQLPGGVRMPGSPKDREMPLLQVRIHEARPAQWWINANGTLPHTSCEEKLVGLWTLQGGLVTR
ncbi:hypothetical protein V5799_005716 [Amblyomma americanum]|uniref:Uncharacterized protein n=1 Tax=Amblyomma americanum TaxID=6943 RepID=A0AAQ4DYH1_AMBAM